MSDIEDRKRVMSNFNAPKPEVAEDDLRSESRSVDPDSIITYPDGRTYSAIVYKVAKSTDVEKLAYAMRMSIHDGKDAMVVKSVGAAATATAFEAVEIARQVLLSEFGIETTQTVRDRKVSFLDDAGLQINNLMRISTVIVTSRNHVSMESPLQLITGQQGLSADDASKLQLLCDAAPLILDYAKTRTDAKSGLYKVISDGLSVLSIVLNRNAVSVSDQVKEPFVKSETEYD